MLHTRGVHRNGGFNKRTIRYRLACAAGRSVNPVEVEMQIGNVVRSSRWFILGLALTLAGVVGVRGMAQTSDQGDPLIAGFKSTYPASVSDAVEQVTGKNGTMRYDMKLMTGSNLVGRAVTALARAVPADQATPTLATKHSGEMIDNAKPGEVGVIVMEGTLDIAAMGNLMGTAAVVRQMAGMVLDGAARDIPDLRKMGLTVYARSMSPATAVGRYATVARNVPVECAGVTVKPGDIIVANEDGVVVIPQEHAEAILKKCQEIDEMENK